MKKLLSVFAVSFLNRRKEKSMEYSTTAINSSKVRIEPVFVTAEFSGGQIEEKVGDRFRIILFTEGKFSAEINERIVQVISPAVLCLNDVSPSRQTLPIQHKGSAGRIGGRFPLRGSGFSHFR